MDKQFSGLIHTRIQTLTNMPNFVPNESGEATTLDILDKKYIDEQELDEYFANIEVISAGEAPIEKGEKGNGK